MDDEVSVLRARVNTLEGEISGLKEQINHVWKIDQLNNEPGREPLSTWELLTVLVAWAQ
jgi:hypothetical protein